MSSSETQYKCEDCGMSFNSQQELQQHANKEHVGTAWMHRTSYFQSLSLSTVSYKICYGKILYQTIKSIISTTLSVQDKYRYHDTISNIYPPSIIIDLSDWVVSIYALDIKHQSHQLLY